MQPFVQVSPVVKMEAAPAGALPEYFAPLDPPDLPEAAYLADLRLEVPVEKTVLVGKRPIDGFPDEAGYLDFARRLGRRKERPAVSSALVDAVAKTLKRRKTNSSGVKRLMRDEIHSVRLAIDEGTRLDPTVARVHFIGLGPISKEARDTLDSWCRRPTPRQRPLESTSFRTNTTTALAWTSTSSTERSSSASSDLPKAVCR
jgi:hypothetical protein